MLVTQLPEFLNRRELFEGATEESFSRIIADIERQAARDAKDDGYSAWRVRDAEVDANRIKQLVSEEKMHLMSAYTDFVDECQNIDWVSKDYVMAAHHARIEIMRYNAILTYLDTYVLFASRTQDDIFDYRDCFSEQELAEPSVWDAQ